MLPDGHAERVYAGVLGKIIGVYLGRPFEGWSHERIVRRFGEVRYYVHEQLGVPLVVTDDDISGTFLFLRALLDHDSGRGLTVEQVGETWRNYIVEGRSTLWWGGFGTSTEHTAYLRLEAGVPAPDSGSAARNGVVTSEQVGAQIFIDGWGMVAPGDPELAARLAGRAARVSHDGEAVFAAQHLAAMEAAAFEEHDVHAIVEAGLSQIPRSCLVTRLNRQLQDWRERYADWHQARALIAGHFGYDRYPGICHVIPNHALVILGLLWGGGDFQESLAITNTSGWDTDCNSGNLGCLLGIRNGLAAFEGSADWRGPVADRLYLSGAEGGIAFSDAVTQTDLILEAAARLGDRPLAASKRRARFHFAYPGSVQGFLGEGGGIRIGNAGPHGEGGDRSLALLLTGDDLTARATRRLFVPPTGFDAGGYELLASPALYPGQIVEAQVTAAAGNLEPIGVSLIAGAAAGVESRPVFGPPASIPPGEHARLRWPIPPDTPQPIHDIGVQVARASAAPATLYLDWLDWHGEPAFQLAPELERKSARAQGWVDAVDHVDARGGSIRISQDRGTGVLSQGTRDWHDYRFEVGVEILLAERAGIAVRHQGRRRYYALLLTDRGTAQLVRVAGRERVLAEVAFPVELYRRYTVSLTARGAELSVEIDGVHTLAARDERPGLGGGGVALICEQGTLLAGPLSVQGLDPS